jgi:leucyl aminopeptidase
MKYVPLLAPVMALSVMALSVMSAPQSAAAADRIIFATMDQAQSTLQVTSQADNPPRNAVIFLDGTLSLPDLDNLLDPGATTALKKAIKAAQFDGDFGSQKTFYGLGSFNAITVLGTGDEALTRRKLHDLGGHMASAPGDDTILIIPGQLKTDVPHPAAELALGYHLGDYKFLTYKTGKTGQKGVTNVPNDDRLVTVIVSDPEADQAMMDKDYTGLADAITLTRDFGSEPGMAVYPEAFVRRVRTAARGVPNLRLKVLELDDLNREGMGGIVGVGKGSVHDPRLLILEYRGAEADQAPIALVGKGITFDTGGISLKPNSGQWLMKSDLSGGAAVGGTLIATAKRKAPINVVGLIPLAENMPDGTAIRPGDVLNTYNGTTIEVMSTDAEGRLLLADAVAYAQDAYAPSLLLNIATLTGSAARALGDDYAALLTRGDWDLMDKMMQIGQRAGEEVWPLPLNDGHFAQINSDIADIKSTAGSPGASIGAAVVGSFVDEDQPWVHLDIAGVDWRDSATPTAPKGHAGWGVRFMDELIRTYEKKQGREQK